ncbi:hypothetical protein SAMN02745866_03648 [Alteromonadaceae bacterium Bs31]|nr:hypothetical protein SAMN02745866_03648 [Alteromonadaceae bacterium Bs31]
MTLNKQLGTCLCCLSLLACGGGGSGESSNGGDNLGPQAPENTGIVPLDSPILGDWLYDAFHYVTIDQNLHTEVRADRANQCMAGVASIAEITSYTDSSFTATNASNTKATFAFGLDGPNLLINRTVEGSQNTREFIYSPSVNLPYGSCVDNNRTGSVSVTFTFNDLANSLSALDLFDDISTARFTAETVFDVNGNDDMDSGDISIRADFIPTSASSTEFISLLLPRLFVYTTDGSRGYFGDGTIEIDGNSITVTMPNTQHPQLQNISNASTLKTYVRLSGDTGIYRDNYPDSGLAIGLDSSSLLDEEYETEELTMVGLDLLEVNVTINN